jgi:hypothetical protein
MQIIFEYNPKEYYGWENNMCQITYISGNNLTVTWMPENNINIFRNILDKLGFKSTQDGNKYIYIP